MAAISGISSVGIGVNGVHGIFGGASAVCTGQPARAGPRRSAWRLRLRGGLCRPLLLLVERLLLLLVLGPLLDPIGRWHTFLERRDLALDALFMG
jgi:hypothetical protein